MKLEDFEKIESDVFDVRFGQINIYLHLHDNSCLVMEKQKKSASREDHDFNCLQAEQRLKLRHDSLMKMVGTSRDDEAWISSAFFEYPNEDMFDRKYDLLNPAESMKYLTHLLDLLAYMQRENIVHGDIRPEYIYFDQRRDRYVLLDRLSESTGLEESQRNNLIYEDKIIFMSPEVFGALANGRQIDALDPFKSECFSLGMVLMAMFVDENELALCYNRAKKQFDAVQFQILAEDFQANFYSGNIEQIISDFLFNQILEVDPEKRRTSRDNFYVLLNTIAPRILKELENRQVNKGWDRVNNLNSQNADSSENQEVKEEQIKNESNPEFVDSKLNPILEESDPTQRPSIDHDQEGLEKMFGSLDDLERISLGNVVQKNGFSRTSNQTFESNVGLEASLKQIQTSSKLSTASIKKRENGKFILT